MYWPSQAALETSQGIPLSLPIFILLLVFLLANGALAILVVLFPERGVQILARFSRFQWEITIGPRWEEFLEQRGRKQDLEFLRRGPYEPQAFPFLVKWFRLFFTLYGIVDFFLLVVWLFAGVRALGK